MGVNVRILVTGDYGYDYDIYLPTAEDNPPPGSPPTRLLSRIGGAVIVHKILTTIKARLPKNRRASITVGFRGCPPKQAKAAPSTAALWQPEELGAFGKGKPDQEAKVWRLRRSLSLGKIPDRPKRPENDPPRGVEPGFRPDILVIEDDAAGFRFNVPGWLRSLTAGPSPDLPEWIILKMTAPVCQGDLWWTLTRDGGSADRLIVLLNVNDLRLEDMRISQGISWERTALDLARELLENPRLDRLRQARHAIVAMHGEGALWMERQPGAKQPIFRLFFDPEHMETEWSGKMRAKSTAYGFLSCFTAAVAARLALPDAKPEGKSIESRLESGIKHGLWAMRLLRGLGHGLVDDINPGLPFDQLAEVIQVKDLKDLSTKAAKDGREIEELTGKPNAPAKNAANVKKKVAQTPQETEKPALDWDRLGAFGKAIIPPDAPKSELPASTPRLGTQEDPPRAWRIMEGGEAVLTRPKDEPLYGLARRVALLGLSALKNSPYARFGRLLTADRLEIESFRNIQRLIHNYNHDKKEVKPLSIAVFGPPGAGKSFGIQQIAREVLGEGKPPLEFNLSQFNDAADLIGALHQVRDSVLEGYVPLVFWDEFDSQGYKWLQYLLAPMQDGKFQEGQITHPIGKSIFVFAGATSYDMEHFGPPREGQSPQEKDARAKFTLLKGPDFKSRLHGYINLLGPNPRQVFHGGKNPGEQWTDDPSDVCFPVRRALMLRTNLGFTDKRESARMDVDTGLLSALLEVGRYSHGARSMGKIVACLKTDDKHGIHRSCLPSDETLTMNVEDLEQFRGIMTRGQDFQKQASQIAPHIHEFYRELCRANRWKIDYDRPYARLPEPIKMDNIAAAWRIPWILSLAGLYLAQSSVFSGAEEAQIGEILAMHEETLAEEEHNLWMAFKVRNGWKLGPKKDNVLKQHPCLKPFKDLDDGQRQKDHDSVKNFPEIAKRAGFKIVADRLTTQC